jgi:murein DD-endopeptidase MepM/ murein hydrolase activator NlpD
MASSTEEVDASNVETVSKADGGAAVVRIAPNESIQTADDRKKASLSQNEREQEFSNSQDRSIADGEVKRLFFTNDSFAPNGATVTGVEYRFRIKPGEDDDEGENFHAEDYKIYVSSSQSEGTREDVNVYNNFGGRTDGGNDDDDADDADIYLDWRSVSLFDDEDANQYWGFVIKDTQSGDRGQIDYLDMRIHYEVPTTLVPPELDGPGTSDRDDPEVVETLTPTLKWDEVDGADEYGLYVSEAPFGSENIVYRDESIDGSDEELVVPSDELQPETNYRWNMVSKADGDESDVSSTLYFQTEAAAPSPPDLDSPGTADRDNPEVVETLTPTLKWDEVDGADEYGLYVSEAPFGSENIVYRNESLDGDAHVIPSGELNPGVDYRWEMVSKSDGEESDVSNTLYFRTQESGVNDPPAAPTLAEPGGTSPPGPLLPDPEQTFQWQSVSGADRYGLYVKDRETGEFVVDRNDISSGQTSYSKTLEAGRRYKWDMRAYANGQWSEYSEDFYFQIEESDGGGDPSAPFAWPVSNHVVSQNYAAEGEVVEGEYHTGIDMVSSSGDLTIQAAAEGTARTVPLETYDNENHGLGNVVVVDHGNRLFTLYAHLASIAVEDGAEVDADTQLGVMGETGNTDAVHLHFELKLWSVLGNLDSDLGPEWGYTPTHPNLWGYLNPYPYLEYSNIEHMASTAVQTSESQIVRTGPNESYTTEVTSVENEQHFSSFAERNGWHQIYLASDHGPTTGWVEATSATGTLLKIDDPERGTVGVNVRANPAASSNEVSHVWDTQEFVYDDVSSAGSGCAASWYRVPLAANSSNNSGWVCGEFVSGEDLPVAPAPPTGLTAEEDDGQVTLSWEANDEDDLSEYRLYRGTSSEPTTQVATIPEGTTRHPDRDVNNGTTYYYRLTAVDTDGNESGYSNEVPATPSGSGGGGACPAEPSADPSPQEISACIDVLAAEYKVPGIIVRALLQQENSTWDNTIVSDDGGRGLTQITIDEKNVTVPGEYAEIPLGYISDKECPADEDLEEGLLCYDGGRNEDFTIRINRNERVNFSKLENDWVENLKTGVRGLLAKKALDAAEPASDHRILENWYNALAFYNGYFAFDNEEDTKNFDDEFELGMPGEYCPDPGEPLEGKCYNDPGFSYPRKGENGTERWNDKQSFPYQEAVFNVIALPNRNHIEERSAKGFPERAISATLPGPSDVGKPDAGGYNFAWENYSKDYEEGRGSKWLDFYVEDGKGYARKSTDCGSDGRFDEIPSDCAWETPVPVTVHRVDNFSDHDAEAVGGSDQRVALNNPERANPISFAKDPDAQSFADLPVSAQTAAADASGTASSEASAAGSLSEYVFWLGDDGTIEYGRISEVDPEPKRGYFVFVDGDAPVTINYSGETANPDVSLHRTMNMTGPTRSTTFASNESVYEEGIYYVEDGEPVRVDPQSEALNPGTAYFLAADEATTYRPSDASSAAAPSTASAAPDTTERPAQRAKIEHMLDRVSARFASLRGAPAKADSLRAASASSETSETCDPDASGAFAVCFAVNQQVSYDDPPLPLELAVETASGATNGWEDDADVVQVEFSTPGLPHAYIDEGYGLQTSAKPSNGDEKTWPLLVTSASRSPTYGDNTNSVRISWSVPQLPDQKQAQLLDEDGSVLVEDMRKQTQLSRSVSDPPTQWRFKIRLSEAESIARTLSVSPGWNMVGMPVTPKAENLGAALPSGCGSRFGWRPTQGSYQKFDSGETLSPGQGAWTFCESGGTASLEGTSSSDKSVEVEAGWNQVGPFEEAIAPSAVGQEPSGILETGSWFGWDPSQGQYVEPSELTPGGGYWVFATGSGTLDFSGGSSQAATASGSARLQGEVQGEAYSQKKASGREKPEGAVTLAVTDEAGHSGEVYLASDLGEEEQKRWRLPPVGPGSAFTARFEGGFQAAAAGSEEESSSSSKKAVLMVQDTEGEATLRMQPSERPSEKGFSGGERSVRVVDAATGGERVDARLTEESPSTNVPARAERLRVQVEELPQEAALRKPAPNPARGQVTLEYALPEEREVTVAVYDVLGRRVATLADGRKKAGTHRAILEASQLPSGTYFARMQAEDFQKTRRLVVVR